MNGIVLRKKAKVFKVKFSGRFKVTKDQSGECVAFELLKFCNSKKNYEKTQLMLTDDGFYVGKRLSVLDIKKKVFYNENVADFFIFKESPQCVVVLEDEHAKQWMSYFKFVDGTEANDFFTYLTNIKSSTVHDEGGKSEHEPCATNTVIGEQQCSFFQEDTLEEDSSSKYRSCCSTKEPEMNTSEDNNVITYQCVVGKANLLVNNDSFTTMRDSDIGTFTAGQDSFDDDWIMKEESNENKEGENFQSHMKSAYSANISLYMFCERWPSDYEKYYSVSESD